MTRSGSGATRKNSRIGEKWEKWGDYRVFRADEICQTGKRPRFSKGKDISGTLRWTDVLIKRNERWQPVTTYIVKIG